MKKCFMLLGLMAMSGSIMASSIESPAYSELWEAPSQELKVVNLSQLNDLYLSEIFQGKHPEVAVEFSAQTILPITFFLKGDLIHLIESDEKWGEVGIKQTFYARCVQNELIFSTDLMAWKPFLEFMTGKASVSLNIEGEKPCISIGAETHLRS